MAYHKLVRDHIPEIIRANGQIPQIRILDDQEYRIQLEKKLDEEVLEFHQEWNTEELADILEVVYALAELQGFSREELDKIYEAKHQQRGGFSNRVFLISKDG